MHDSRKPALGDWHIVGAGRIGTLAARYLERAGARVTVVRPGPRETRRVALCFADARPPETLALSVVPPAECGPVCRLVVACKTPYTASALARVRLRADALVLRLQNGIGSLDNRLRAGQRLIEAVTASAVTSTGADQLRVVSENATRFGGGPRPGWFDALAAHWPNLGWEEDVRASQWAKLLVNAAVNPITAIFDVPNGALLERADLRAEMTALIDEADGLLARLDPSWPANSYDAVASVIRDTAANTSSMRADIQAGATTEIEAINGWLLRRAAELALDLPTHRRVIARVHALEPSQ